MLAYTFLLDYKCIGLYFFVLAHRFVLDYIPVGLGLCIGLYLCVRLYLCILGFHMTSYISLGSPLNGDKPHQNALSISLVLVSLKENA